MKILLLTSLYPDFKSTTYQRQTKALHDFAKFWVRQPGIDVLVVKMHFYPRDEKDLSPRKNYISDKVPIAHIFQFDKGAFHPRNINLRFFLLYLKLTLGRITLDEYNLNNLIELTQNRSFRPDVILSHSMLTFKPASQLSDFLGVPFILGFHKSDMINWIKPGKWQIYVTRYVNKATALVFRSPSIADQAPLKDIEEKKPTFIAPSGINLDWVVDTEKATLKMKEWKTKQRPIRFISVCYLEKGKNLAINLRAFHSLQNDCNFTYEIIGDGTEKENLEALTTELGLEERVVFHGRLSHESVMKILRTTDIFIMVSRPETFGLAYLEAIACGNLVVAAKGEGIDGVFSEENVIFVKANDEEHLYLKIKEDLLQQNEDSLEKRLMGSSKELRSMDENKMALNYLSFIRSIVHID